MQIPERLARGRRSWLWAPLALSYLWFFLLEIVRPEPVFWVHLSIDDAIPFVKEFIVPYVSWYVYVFGALLWYWLRDTESFSRLCSFTAAGVMFSCLVYTVLPNGQQLRPEALGGDVFSRICSLLFSVDTPTNSLPSIHIILAVGAHISVWRSPMAGMPLKLASLALCILICLSTMFVKQHSALCVLAGFAVAAALYLIFYRDILSRRRRERRAET